MLNPENIWHEYLTRLSTLPVRCSYCTLGNLKKSFSTVLFFSHFWFFMLSLKKTNCNPLAHPTWKCHHTNLWITKLFHLTEGLLRFFKRWKLRKEPVVGCRQWPWKEPLTTTHNWLFSELPTGKQCHSEDAQCLEWPPSALIHAFSLFRHWSVA